jgi:hypothetical protein
MGGNMCIERQNVEFVIPHFELAKLKRFPLDSIIRAKNQNLAKFMLALSVVYNDFKDYAWFKQLFDDTIKTIDQSKITGMLGQLNGMSEHCIRMFIAQLLELLILLKEHYKLYDCKDFKTIMHYLGKIDKRLPSDWWTLVRLAESNESTDRFHNTLIRIRNNGTYHYKNTKCLSQGLHYYIKKKGKDGYISLGQSLMETRYYFGDAAIQYYHKKTTDDYGSDFVNKVDEYLHKVNTLLRFVIEIYLKQILNAI